MIVRDAEIGELSALTELALRAKAHWGYDAAFMAACRAELTVDARRFASERLRVAAVETELAGFASFVVEGAAAELCALFVAPEHMGRGVGSLLLEDVASAAKRAGARELVIEADPNAAAWYVARGARHVGDAPSGSIPGRRLPKLVLDVQRASGD